MKLTKAQKSLLLRELNPYRNGGFFIILSSAACDRTAINLESKGLGYFTNHKSLYSWRRRSGYTNNFTPNDLGMQCIRRLKKGPCSCVYENSRNSKAVRDGAVLSGAILVKCDNCKEVLQDSTTQSASCS